MLSHRPFPIHESARRLGRVSAPLALLCSVSIAGSAQAQTAIYDLSQPAPGGNHGRIVRLAGDVDADGFPDLIAGAPSDATAGVNAGAVRVFSGRTGMQLHAFPGSGPGSSLGSALDGAGDLDADGFADLIAGEPKAGKAWLWSGANGLLLRVHAEGVPFDQYGNAVSGAGDADGDGFDDYAVAAWGDDSGGANAGLVKVYSGASGLALYAHPGDSAGDELGNALAAAGDWNGDGKADLLVAAWKDAAGGTGSGSVLVLGGPSGLPLGSFAGPTPNGFFGAALAAAGDVDGNGAPDLIAGAPFDGGAATEAGRVQVRSGVLGGVLHDLQGAAAYDHFGSAVAGLGDVDGDGRADFSAGASEVKLGPAGGPLGPGYVRLYSGLSGTVLHTKSGAAVGEQFGVSLAGNFDLNADGHPDLAVGAPGFDPNGSQAAYVRVLSSTPLPLAANAHFLSLASGGTQAFALAAGAGQAGKVHLLLGSVSGSQPGLALGSLVLPLNPDAYTLFTLLHPNTPPLSGALGVLDGAGAASAAFHLPAGSSGTLAGVVAHHAYVVLGAALNVELASNAVPLTLMP